MIGSGPVPRCRGTTGSSWWGPIPVYRWRQPYHDTTVGWRASPME